MPAHFQQPPRPLNHDGHERAVGFEFEFTGVEMKDTASLIANLYGGHPEELSTYQYQIKGTRFGIFAIELDASLLLHKQYERILASVGINLATFKNKHLLEDALRDLAATVVPFEIITPPIPLSQLADLNPMVDALRKWKAKGTGSSPLYAFGLHLNPEVPELTAESLLRHLQAYTMLDAWIRKDAKVDLSRQLTPYINEFEPDYIRFILREHYQPDLQTLIRDYFTFGNSRNRPLDLLPVFMHLEPALTKSLQTDHLTSARPTFHYRLPNCSIEDPTWSLAHEWNRWSLVEQLAEDTPALRKHAALYLSLDDNSLFSIKRKWVKLIDKWLRRET